MKVNQSHLPSVEAIAEYAEPGDYPASASGALEDEQTPYFVRDVVWIGDEGLMMKVDPDYILHISGNIFYPDKLGAVVRGIREAHDRVYFYAPYGTPTKIDLNDVIESQEYWFEEGLDQPYTTGDDELDRYVVDPESVLEEYGEKGDEDWIAARREFEAAKESAVDNNEGDIGSWVVTIRDGNHRAFGALIAGEPYIWVRIDANTYQDLMHAQKTGTLTDSEAELLEMLE